eukprot:CAMPEP_0183393020 /NCGR_PEP_ID=MMETSP0370-20130417/7651_1 /TAXON_ID=268820 /ORGANISM="Peridinium aciculiferum, Strain PAER-2" /LENGTH=172 /DNA_ID=CAMNT_0025573147 /DNA_START=356 /DNA_END=871 /DNA_ORIENTATION=+
MNLAFLRHLPPHEPRLRPPCQLRNPPGIQRATGRQLDSLPRPQVLAQAGERERRLLLDAPLHERKQVGDLRGVGPRSGAVVHRQRGVEAEQLQRDAARHADVEELLPNLAREDVTSELVQLFNAHLEAGAGVDLRQRRAALHARGVADVHRQDAIALQFHREPRAERRPIGG